MSDELNYLTVTALHDFTMLGFPAFEAGKEYKLPEGTAKTLLSRNMVEVTVVNVDKLDEVKGSKSSKRAAM